VTGVILNETYSHANLGDLGTVGSELSQRTRLNVFFDTVVNATKTNPIIPFTRL
jgi:hypothetical protein